MVANFDINPQEDADDENNYESGFEGDDYEFKPFYRGKRSDCPKGKTHLLPIVYGERTEKSKEFPTLKVRGPNGGVGSRGKTKSRHNPFRLMSEKANSNQPFNI